MSNSPAWDFGGPPAMPDSRVERPPGDLWGDGAGSDGSFDRFSTSSGPGPQASAPAIVRPPLGVLLAGCGAAVVGLLLALVASGRPVVALLAWFVGGFVAIGLLGLFTVRDGRRRADSWYAASTAVPVLRMVLLAVALAAVSTSAWRFADLVARSPR